MIWWILSWSRGSQSTGKGIAGLSTDVSHQLSNKQISNFIIAETEQWYVGPNITDSKGWMISQDISQSAVPQYNWSYYDNKWIKDETLMFE